MSGEATHLQRAGSPAFPGRASPVNPRRRVEDDGGPVKDKATRRYAAGIDRALSLYDSALQEWADYISFLGRLLKALQVHPPGISDVPHKSLVSQRLSQCLNPTLPAGVHQKALEVYTYIFSLIGKAGLGRDLSLYLPGLSPVLAFASLSTKPALLSLFDTFIVALDPIALRPALKAIILGLLPGLEEESSEEFEQTLDILQRLKKEVAQEQQDEDHVQDASGHQFFWQCLFLSTITSPSRRQGALAYLQRSLPRLGKSSGPQNREIGREQERRQKLSDEVEAVTSPEPGLLVRCFVAGLNDPNLLIQRGFLDLLVSHLPLHSEVLRRKVSTGDLVKLTTAAVSVVSRREMSLNRRLWTWFLGPKDPPSNQKPETASPKRADRPDQDQGRQIRYFRHYGLSPLSQGILDLLETKAVTPAEKARPFRVALALMDRWEIGSLVVPNVFLPALKSIWRYQKTARTSEEFTEVLRSANGFFDGIESGLIWDELSNKLLCATSMEVLDTEDFRERLDLTAFVIANFDLQEEEMLLCHIPVLALSLLLKSQALISQSKTKNGEPEALRSGNKVIGTSLPEIVKRILMLVRQLMDILPGQPVAAHEAGNPSGASPNLETENQGFLMKTEEYYRERRGKAQSSDLPVDRSVLGRLMLSNILQMIKQKLCSDEVGQTLDITISILDKACRKLPQSSLLEVVEILSDVQEAAKHKITVGGDSVNQLTIITTLVSLLETLRAALPAISQDHRLRLILPDLVSALWPYLSPGNPKSNVEAVRCVWRIHSLSVNDSLVESCVTSLMVGHRGIDIMDIESARRFGILWSNSNSSFGSHTGRSSLIPSTPRRGTAIDRMKEEHMLARPLLLLLGLLEDNQKEMFIFMSGWLQSLANIEVIVNFLQGKLQTILSDTADTADASFGVDECLYYLRTLSNLVEQTPEEIWPSLLAKGGSEEQAEQLVNKENYPTTTQTSITTICLKIIDEEFEAKHSGSPALSRLQQTAVSLLGEVVLRSLSISEIGAEIESPMLTTLSRSIRKADHPLQVSLLNLASVWLRRRLSHAKGNPSPSHRRILSGDHGSPKSLSQDRLGKEEQPPLSAVPPALLLDCLLQGIASTGSQTVLGQWIRFLNFCLPFYISNIFQILMPISDRIIKAAESIFEDLQASFQRPDLQNTVAEEPINAIVELLNGLEQVLAQAHDRLSEYETSEASIKTPEQAQGFFNSMVSGVFPSDAHKSRSATANNRLTVLLCFKDAIKLCVRIWAWGAGGSKGASRELAISSSFSPISVRLRHRVRRILEHMFAAESLECLETLIESWGSSPRADKSELASPVILNLLHVLEGSRPRNTIPAIFNALYSRTNPGALDAERKSMLTSELSDIDIAQFLVQYTKSLEDDAMDEIWLDCMTFLKDVLANPLPHRQTLPKLLEFTALLGVKVDDTNFGDNRKRRRELADLFLRQLTATFTTKPLSFPIDVSAKSQKPASEHLRPLGVQGEMTDDGVVAVLAAIVPNLSKILVESDRIITALNVLSTQVVLPTLRWKSFPRNVTAAFLDLLLFMARAPEASKVWRRDIGEAFNDARFFCEHLYDLASTKWLPLLSLWITSDKERMNELLLRMPSPTAAGIMFGVGASSARLEADRRTQLNLRRVATLLLATPTDSFALQLGVIQEKILDLLNATAASSPSSATRAEVYTVVRALILKTSPVRLASMWPSLTTELHEAISSLYPGHSNDKYNIHCVVHACKLLDILLLTAPEDFQMREWLFITDTIDAVYRPQGLETCALVDDLVEDLDASAGATHSAAVTGPSPAQTESRKPLLTTKSLEGIPREKLLDRAIRPFLRQMSINAFEGTYSMTTFDWQAAFDDVLFDIFDEKTLV
ncbi:MAG: hypothetical protein Q9207_000162 [Kuettlingeria erythrocarpa]